MEDQKDYHSIVKVVVVTIINWTHRGQKLRDLLAAFVFATNSWTTIHIPYLDLWSHEFAEDLYIKWVLHYLGGESLSRENYDDT